MKILVPTEQESSNFWDFVIAACCEFIISNPADILFRNAAICSCCFLWFSLDPGGNFETAQIDSFQILPFGVMEFKALTDQICLSTFPLYHILLKQADT